MNYKKGIYYFMDKTDEVITFNPNVYTNFKFEQWYSCGKKISPLGLLLLSFFHQYACEVWKDGASTPDHDVAIKVTNADLAELFGVEENIINKAIQELIENELLGVLLLPTGYYAYHIVL